MLTRSFFLVSATLLIACADTHTSSQGSDALTSIERVSGDKVVATVNGTQIYESDVNVFAHEQGHIDEGVSLPGFDPRFRELLEELIDQRLLALDADKIDLASDQEAQIRLAAARERILGNLRVERHLQAVVNETSIRRMYEEQAKLAARGDEVRARHILVSEKAEADTLLNKITAGEDFAALAQESSIDEGSAGRGGDLGYFTQDMLNDRFTRPVFQAGKGEVIGPVKSEFGWHIAEILDRRPAPQPTFETLRPKIVNFMTFDAIQELLLDLRETGDIDILLEAAQAETPEPTTPSEE